MWNSFVSDLWAGFTLLLFVLGLLAFMGLLVLVLRIVQGIQGWIAKRRAMRLASEDLYPSHVVNPGDRPEHYHGVLILKERYNGKK